MADKHDEKKVMLRIPGALKTDLELLAARERRSLNQQAVVIFEQAVAEARRESAAA